MVFVTATARLRYMSPPALPVDSANAANYYDLRTYAQMQPVIEEPNAKRAKLTPLTLPMLRLPDDAMGIIMSYLSVFEVIGGLPQVCTAYNEAATTSNWKSRPDRLGPIPHRLNGTLQVSQPPDCGIDCSMRGFRGHRLCTVMSKLAGLSFTHVTLRHSLDCTLRHMAQWPLQSLSLPGSRSITDTGILALCNLKALTSLDLRGCTLLTTGLGHIASVAPKLTALNLSSALNLSLDLGTCLALAQLPLRDLDLRGCHPVGTRAEACQCWTAIGSIVTLRSLDVSSRAIVKLRCLTTNLQRLDLAACRNIPNSDCDYLARLPRLECLNLSGQCKPVPSLEQRFTDVGVAYLQDLPLTRLDLTGCRWISGQALQHLTRLPLRYLILRHTDLCNGFEHLACITTLLELDLSRPPSGLRGPLLGLGGSPLRVLNLSACDDVKDDIVHTALALPALVSLELFRTSLTDIGLAGLQRVPHLRHVGLVGCRRITDVGIAQFLARGREVPPRGFFGLCIMSRNASVTSTMHEILGSAFLRTMTVTSTGHENLVSAGFKAVDSGFLEGIPYTYFQYRNEAVEDNLDIVGQRLLYRNEGVKSPWTELAGLNTCSAAYGTRSATRRPFSTQWHEPRKFYSVLPETKSEWQRRYENQYYQ
jgi:hypothetical protein